MPNSRSHRRNKSTMSKPNKVNPSPNPHPPAPAPAALSQKMVRTPSQGCCQKQTQSQTQTQRTQTQSHDQTPTVLVAQAPFPTQGPDIRRSQSNAYHRPQASSLLGRRIKTVPMKGAEQWRSRYQFQMFSWDEGQDFDDDEGEADEDKGWNWDRDVRKYNGGAEEWINSLSWGGTPISREYGSSISPAYISIPPGSSLNGENNIPGMSVDALTQLAAEVAFELSRKRLEESQRPDVGKRKRAEGNVSRGF
ncbi:hypothetical protein I310_05394 [Cryptococcus deuterogattii CA1014]|nr:hypothetical protein I310_05394 [Cryptococcus deuterogattii CA1014]